MRFMIRMTALFLAGSLIALPMALTSAAAAPAAAAKVTATAKADPKKGAKKDTTASATSGALELGKFGDWGAYMAGNGPGKVCFVLSQPKDRLPKGLTRDPAYLFITSRPAQNVRNEVSFMIGFAMKPGVDSIATLDGKNFALEAKDKTAFVKNAAEEPRFVDAMRNGSKLSVKSTSGRGNVTTDSYVLTGLGKALEKLQTDCK